MDLLKSVVFAAIISGVVGVIVAWISARTALKINKDKIKLDKQLAEKRDIAERENLARKFDLERKATLAQKKAELAEKVLHDFYQISFTLQLIRSPMVWASEMIAEDGVPDEVVQNAGYGVMRRMREHRHKFDELETSKFKCAALFGPNAVELFDEIVRIYNRIWFAGKAILDARHAQTETEFVREMRRIAFSVAAVGDDGEPLPDPIQQSIDQTIAQVEELCRPFITEGALVT
ncbi:MULTISPECIES: hypothetical protein [unclassified Brevundimonas]|uniref:hypothetical protein n=1 Tax=unclassified Brevundimonas TaxID=2622653 RepID=UPI0025BBE6A7|nr:MULTISPECIES: hypothetical protein [unclassified Brevundimonas]